MKTVSLSNIILLCVAILLIDIAAFYWLQSLTQLIDFPALRIFINVLFWLFTIGLLSSILVLKATLDKINPIRKQVLISKFYGLGVLSFVPKFFFVFVISSLYFTNYLFSERVSYLVIAMVGLLSGILPFLVILYGIFKALYRFKVYTHTISSKLLPKSFGGLRIVQISDLHLGSFNYSYNKLSSAVEIINNLKPDYIVFTGDLVNNYAIELRGWDKVFNKLIANKGKYAVLGNHDYGDYSEWNSMDEKQENFEAIKQFYIDVGFNLLLNEAEILTVNNDEIAMIGVENWGKSPFKQVGDLNKALSKVKDVPFKILLSHDPTHWTEEVLKHTDIFLTLSGHTHGMQAAFQYKNLQWSPIKYKFKHWAGLYEENNQYLYVNRGLGWLGLPARIGMRPEITMIELKNESFVE
ncbi:MAG TPA: metallophosphoesterase [Brumimicrobium sp.]|nr:metallophosphoesterase [Brumimicrobium sp.]